MISMRFILENPSILLKEQSNIILKEEMRITGGIKYCHTKTNAGTRKLPKMENVFRYFQAIIEDREKLRFENMMDSHTGFLFTDKGGLPLVAMHWEY